jgi:hypothetical protein
MTEQRYQFSKYLTDMNHFLNYMQSCCNVLSLSYESDTLSVEMFVDSITSIDTFWMMINTYTAPKAEEYIYVSQVFPITKVNNTGGFSSVFSWKYNGKNYDSKLCGVQLHITGICDLKVIDITNAKVIALISNTSQEINSINILYDTDKLPINPALFELSVSCHSTQAIISVFSFISQI